MSDKIVISLDIGTSNLCALALSCDSLGPVAICSKKNDTEIANLATGYHEQDPLRIRDLCLELIQKLLSEKDIEENAVVSIGITGQMHGVLLVNPDLQPQSNLITWRDQRTLADNKPGSINESGGLLDKTVHERTGCRLHAGYGGATLQWLQKHGQLSEGAVALTIADYVAACLTGVCATEQTHAASWGIFNLQKGRWDSEAIDKLGIPEKVLPAVNSTAKPLGTIQPAIAQQLGLGPDVQVCRPVGDNQASIIGAAGFADDVLVLNLGTGGQISIPQKEYKFVETFETRPMPFGGFILVGASLCGGWSYTCLQKFIQATVREFAGTELSDEEVYNRMNAIAAETAKGASGISVDTRFSGTRLEPNIRGSISGIGVDNFTIANLIRGFVEGMVVELADMASTASIKDFTRIIASGNAVRNNPVVSEVIESIFGLPCHISFHREEAALGAAYSAAIGLGLASKDDVCPDSEKGE
ncbi:MAG: sedoheptulokinase [Planctomycetota bacterium]|jgi:sugar (pentulose or hexulose) kinase